MALTVSNESTFRIAELEALLEEAERENEELRAEIQKNTETLRDKFAGQALSGIDMLISDPEYLAIRAYEMADAMLAAREGDSNAPR